MPSWIFFTQVGSRLVLLVLFGLSVWSVSIMIDRNRILKGQKGSDDLDKLKDLIGKQDRQALLQWTQSNPGLRSGALKAALDVNSSEVSQIERAVRSYLAEEKSKLEQGFAVLATLGSNAPFIGLFGTVLGIIQAFGMLSAQQGGTNTVMSGIAEALIATAFGLFVAIPAVVAYNVFTRKLRLLLVDCESLRDFYISRLPHGR